LKRHRCFALNRISSLVWKRCDEKTTYRDVAALIEKEFEVTADPELVRLIVARLGGLGLVEKRGDTKRYSRRELLGKLRKLGLTASFVLPLVTSIVAPPPAMALSCVEPKDCRTASNCTPCNPPGCNGLCCNGLCLPAFLASWFCGC
jgi:hypothetical protein